MMMVNDARPQGAGVICAYTNASLHGARVSVDGNDGLIVQEDGESDEWMENDG